ncbi:MAG: hypothetical protein OHK0029_00110 [Armatimonadaceae bacterium]
MIFASVRFEEDPSVEQSVPGTVTMMEWVSASMEDVFEATTALENLPRIYNSMNPVPSVVSVAMVDGGRLRQGGIRRILLSDGNFVDEHITLLLPPLRLIYLIKDSIPTPLPHRIAGAVSEMALTPTQGGTRIRWDFRYEADRTPFPLVNLRLKRQLLRNQQDCLREIKRIAEG